MDIESSSLVGAGARTYALEAWGTGGGKTDRNETPAARERVERKYWCELGAYDKDRYITGSAALNLADPGSGEQGGFADWHGLASWKMSRPSVMVEHIGDGKYRTPWGAIGEAGIREGNREIRGIGHPEGSRKEPIWVASHTRAILDIAFTRWSGKRLHRTVPIAGTMVSDWLWSEKQMQELKEWIEKAGELLPSDRRTAWNRWGEGLMFGAGYEYYRSGAAA